MTAAFCLLHCSPLTGVRAKGGTVLIRLAPPPTAVAPCWAIMTTPMSRHERRCTDAAEPRTIWNFKLSHHPAFSSDAIAT
jgi:hypothetical protein